MIRIFLGFFLSFLVLSCGSSKTKFENISFAEIKKGEYIFLKDTLVLKKHILENISFSKSVSLNKTRIIKQKIINSDSRDFYYALWTNSESNLKIAKWLEKKGNKLFFVNSSSEKYEDFKKHYLLCVGSADCFPELIATDSSKVWNCSKELKCLSTPIDSSQVSSCRTYKTIILDE